MPLFHYKARTTAGALVDGMLEASDKYALARTLRLQGAVVMHAEEGALRHDSFAVLVAKTGFTLSTVGLREKVDFIHNLSAMLEAGLPLTRGLSVLERQSTNTTLKKIIAGLIQDISRGDTFALALKKYPNVFPPLFVAMAKAGEESGTLPESLRIVGEHLEKTYELRKKIHGALIYPAIVITAMVIIGILMLLYVVPTITATFKDLHVQLPPTTQFVISVSDLVVNYYYLMIPGLAAFIAILIFFFKKTARGQRMFAWIVLHIPVIGMLAKETNSAMTARTLSALLSSGVAMTQSISITGDVLQNVYYKEVLRDALHEVEKGIVLSEVLGRYPNLYLPMVMEMIAVGEESGKLTAMLMRVAQFFEADVDRATKDLSTIIEPLLMIIIGVGVGFFAISMLGPMYSLSNSI